MHAHRHLPCEGCDLGIAGWLLPFSSTPPVAARQSRRPAAPVDQRYITCSVRPPHARRARHISNGGRTAART